MVFFFWCSVGFVFPPLPRLPPALPFGGAVLAPCTARHHGLPPFAPTSFPHQGVDAAPQPSLLLSPADPGSFLQLAVGRTVRPAKRGQHHSHRARAGDGVAPTGQRFAFQSSVGASGSSRRPSAWVIPASCQLVGHQGPGAPVPPQHTVAGREPSGCSQPWGVCSPSAGGAVGRPPCRRSSSRRRRQVWHPLRRREATRLFLTYLPSA